MFAENLIPSRRAGAVAVETAGNEAIFFYHDGAGFRTEPVPFHPFLLLGERTFVRIGPLVERPSVPNNHRPGNHDIRKFRAPPREGIGIHGLVP